MHYFRATSKVLPEIQWLGICEYSTEGVGDINNEKHTSGRSRESSLLVAYLGDRE